ncbi:hypothetical protein AXF42_Ash004192 [Apostasia shenzhenica]|uniref:Uncharacterized protein n=1 Tax=Apostasia shenzhenica TaxID=1088818 RepID=A0A2I0A265_9ASPA|nr:hypothetical protein AXF42_Ash004192 [Apostasia shenzhenica]
MMDPKASAKAKRSHTQKGRRNNLSPAAIAQKKKATQAVSEEKVRRSHFHALPSNWDRYDSGEDEPETAAGKIPADGEGEVEVAPKSKGADYGYLIEQAQSQQQKHRGTAEVESSSYFFDEQPIATCREKVRVKRIPAAVSKSGYFSVQIPSIIMPPERVRGSWYSNTLPFRLILPRVLQGMEICRAHGAEIYIRIWERKLHFLRFHIQQSCSGSLSFLALPTGRAMLLGGQGASIQITIGLFRTLGLCVRGNSLHVIVPYLTMDLHALAAKLSKLKLSKRLFIEEDLLPEDLVSYEFNASSSSAQSQRHEVPELAQNLGTPHSTHCPEITSIFHADEYQNPNLLQSSTFNAREAEESIQNTCKTSTFKARGPEEELDLLLQSFGSTSISGFSHDHIFDEKPASKMAFDPSRKAFLDDSIDHLLAETSAAAAPFDELPAETSMSPTDLNFTSKTNEAASFKDQSSSLGSKSAIDDFDSWIDSF